MTAPNISSPSHRAACEDRQLRDHLDSGLRQLRVIFDRRDRARSERHIRGLGRHWRTQQPAQRRLWGRSLQIRRRRAQLPQGRPG